jgi:hypothetical protein
MPAPKVLPEEAERAPFAALPPALMEVPRREAVREQLAVPVVEGPHPATASQQVAVAQLQLAARWRVVALLVAVERSPPEALELVALQQLAAAAAALRQVVQGAVLAARVSRCEAALLRRVAAPPVGWAPDRSREALRLETKAQRPAGWL